MSRIERIRAREILDSRGNPTVQAEVECAGGAIGVGAVPSGASTGRFEAFELRDEDEKRYRGKGVLTAVAHVNNEIHAALLGKDAGKQRDIDRTMLDLDGTPSKRRLGANAILAVSLACARAEAASQGLPLYLYLQQLFPGGKPSLPVPLINVINGGKHANNPLSVQEFQIIPVGAATFSEALRWGAEVYHTLREVVKEANVAVGLGDEGGYDALGSKALDESAEAFTFLVRAIERAGYDPASQVVLGIDVAASEFFEAEKNQYQIDRRDVEADGLSELYRQWTAQFPIISIEDPFQEEGWQDWSVFTKEHSSVCQIIGDDFFVTNPTRIERGIREKAATAVLVKPNQIGTLSETLQAIALAQKAGMNVIISHRSGETADTFIADLAVACGAGQIKAGAPARSERTEKYNRLLEIEERLQLPLAQPLQGYRTRLSERYRGSREIVYT
ncbi:MAG: phosphopyruvate hydratase [Patescibacteria group bacterium]